MKSTLILFLLIFNVALLQSQTTPCACGSHASGVTIEFTIIDDGRSCCNGTVTQGSGYYFEWEHQGGGVYALIFSDRFELASDAQKKCCEDAS